MASRHDYYPYGAEVVPNPDDEPHYKFTGHSRDTHGLTDYMLGRACAFPLMRFMSVDPGRDGWNMYAYVGGNPVNAVDPSGLYQTQCNGDAACEQAALTFEMNRLENLKSSMPGVAETSRAYGDPGENNGVIVAFGPSEEGAAANAAQAISYDDATGMCYRLS